MQITRRVLNSFEIESAKCACNDQWQIRSESLIDKNLISTFSEQFQSSFLSFLSFLLLFGLFVSNDVFPEI